MAWRFNWLNLPDLVVFLIADKLIYIKDYVRFGAVCQLWRSVYTENRNRLPRQLPMLMLPTELNVDHMKHSFYSITEKNVSNFQVAVPRNLFYRGSSYGWLATVSKSYQVCLLNPLMSVNNEIQLPPLTTFQYKGAYCYNTSDFLDKVVLSENPTANPNYVAMAIYGALNRLAFCMPGDNAWTSLPSRLISDVIYYRDQFYVVNKLGQVFAWDLKHDHRMVSKISPRLKLSPNRRYLVESAGELLQVVRSIESNAAFFEVFKLDSVGWKWTKLANLHGCVLFLGNISSLSVSASDFPECKPNSIYYTDDGYGWSEVEDWPDDQLPPLDMGVFSLEDGKFVDSLYPVQPKGSVPVPIWLVPTL